MDIIVFSWQRAGFSRKGLNREETTLQGPFGKKMVICKTVHA
jgi:hypothetical protein